MGERQLKVTILGEDKGGAKALQGIKAAGDQVGPSAARVDGALRGISSTLSGQLPVGGAQAQAALGRLTGSLSTSIQSMGGAQAAAVGLAAVGGAALLKFAFDGAKAFTGATAEVRKLKGAMGSTAEEASMLRNIGKSLGLDVDTLAKGFVQFDKRLESNASFLNEHGVAMARNRDGSINQYETLLNLGDAYKKITDPIEKNIFLTTVFGKAGTDLRAVLSGNREEMEKFAKSGSIFNDDDLKKGREMTISQRELSKAMQQLQIDIGKGIVPLITGLTQDVTRFTHAVDESAKGGGFWGSVLKDVGKILGGQAFAHETVTDKTKKHARAQAELEQQIIESTEKIEEQNRALDKMASAQERAIGTTMGLTDAHQRAADAAEKVDDAQRELNEAITEHGAGSEEATDAQRKLEDAHHDQERVLVGLAQAMRDQKVAQLEANGETVSGAQKADLLRQAMVNVAQTVKDPLRTQILGLASNIKVDLPAEKKIDINVNTGDALSEIERLRVAIAHMPRDVRVNFEGVGGYSESSNTLTQELALGGWVKGARGKPVPVIAHGGEYVLTAEEASAYKQARSSSTAWASSSVAGAGRSGSGPTEVLQPIAIYIDGQKVAEATARANRGEARRYADRNGRS